MDFALMAVVLAVVAYAFEELEVDKTILVIVLIAVLFADIIGLDEALAE